MLPANKYANNDAVSLGISVYNSSAFWFTEVNITDNFYVSSHI